MFPRQEIVIGENRYIIVIYVLDWHKRTVYNEKWKQIMIKMSVKAKLAWNCDSFNYLINKNICLYKVFISN